MSVQEKLTAIADAIRGKTGSTDALTLDQMAAAIAGISGGSSGGNSGGASGIYMAQITPAEDLARLAISHNLGTTDILLVAAWAETLGDIVPTTAKTLAKFWVKTDIVTQRGGTGFSPAYTWDTSNAYATPKAPNVAAYETLSVADENTITLIRATSAESTNYQAGLTYTVIVIAANAEV